MSNTSVATLCLFLGVSVSSSCSSSPAPGEQTESSHEDHESSTSETEDSIPPSSTPDGTGDDPDSSGDDDDDDDDDTSSNDGDSSSEAGESSEESGESDDSESAEDAEDSEDSEDSDESGSTETGEDPDEDPDDLVPARGDISISLVEANQVVAAELVNSDGKLIAPDQREASLVSERKTLFRAYWSLPSNWKARDIIGRLQFEYEDGSKKSFDETVTVNGESKEADLKSTFTWLIEGEHIEPKVKFQIKLLEDKETNTDIPESSTPAIAPSSGFEFLGNEPDPVELKITIVPLQFKSGSCNTDSADVFKKPEQLQGLYDIMFSRNHAQKLTLTIREESVAFTGSKWNEVLQLMQKTRMADNAPANEYYYGLVDACGEGLQGFGGMSKIPGGSEGEGNSRVASGQWAQKRLEYSYVTFVHELGHTQGLRHAPCGSAGGPDPDFPHDGAKLGTWGYDIINDLYKEPTKVTDYMSYCYIPSWCSDYHCKKTFSREKKLTSWDYRQTSDSSEIAIKTTTDRRRIDRSNRAPQGELLYGSVLNDDPEEMWWTVSGDLSKDRFTPDNFVEFYVGDKLLAKQPALVESYSEPGYGDYIVAQVPMGFDKVTRVVRVTADQKRFAVDPKTVERDYLLYYSVEDKMAAANMKH